MRGGVIVVAVLAVVVCWQGCSCGLLTRCCCCLLFVAAVPLVLVEGPRCEGVLYRCCYSCWCCVLTSLRVFVVEAVLSLLVFVWVFCCFVSFYVCFVFCVFVR